MAEVLLPFGDKLPVELQEMIFGYLGSDMVLESRLVCKNWKNFVDEFMGAKIWKPYFVGNDASDNLLSFMGMRNRNKTKFTSSQQVEAMMREYVLDNQQAETTCRQIIIQCQSVPEYTSLCPILPAVFTRFGNVLCNLVYYVHGEVPESVSNISLIAHMTNLQSLVIYCSCWSSVRHLLKKYLSHNNTVFQIPKALKNLTVLGNGSQLFLSYVFSSHCPNIKQLKLCGYNSELLHKISPATLFAHGLRALPNVEDLKLCNMRNPELLARWPVKRLSLKMESDDCLENILKSIEKFAGTLEYLYLHLTDEQVWFLPERFMKLAFPNVQDLRFSYFAKKGLRNLSEMKRIFPNIKHFQLVDTKNEVQQAMLEADNEDDPLQVIKDILVPFWEQLPDGLEIISVRYRNYKNNNGVGGEMNAACRYSYTVHKYFEKKKSTCASKL